MHGQTSTRTCEFGGFVVIGSIGEQNGLDVHIVEGLNVITVLNVITFGPKCNKPPMQSLNSFSALLLERTSALRR